MIITNKSLVRCDVHKGVILSRSQSRVKSDRGGRGVACGLHRAGRPGMCSERRSHDAGGGVVAPVSITERPSDSHKKPCKEHE